MATIVEYNPNSNAANAYPRRIISPPFASPCCMSEMKQVGKLMKEDGWSFFYKRCGVCGYTVRHIFSVGGELESRSPKRADKLRKSRWGVFGRWGPGSQVWGRRPPGERHRGGPVAKRARRG